MTEKQLPARVLRYDGRVDNPQPPSCLECKTPLPEEKFDVGYCDEICARTAMMKRTQK